MPSHHEQNAMNREQFGKQAERYARLGRGWQSNAVDFLVSALKLGRTDRVLDVGCGPGRLTLSLAQHAAHATGIDLTPEMLAQAKAQQAELGIKNVDWQLGDILPLPFADGTFSVVVTQATFHHFADPKAVLAEMARVCGVGGRIAINDLAPNPAKSAAFDEIETLRDPSHVHALPPEDLRRLGRALEGFKEVAFRQHVTKLPSEAVLASSSPPPGHLERVRALYNEDAVSGKDRFGMGLREEDEQIFAHYPMAMLVLRRPR